MNPLYTVTLLMVKSGQTVNWRDLSAEDVSELFTNPQYITVIGVIKQ